LTAVEPLRGLASYEMIAYACVIILVTIFLPDGIISIPERVRPLIRRLRGIGRSSREIAGEDKA